MRETIIQEAMRQILKLGLKKFTVEDIAKELGVSKKTIYKYFSTKNEIISAVVEFVLEKEKIYTQGVMEMEGSSITKMDALLFFHAGDNVPAWVVDDLRRYYPKEYQKREAIQLMKKECFNRLLLEGVQAGVIRKDCNQGILNIMVRQTIDAILDGEFLRSQDLTLTQAIRQLKEIVLYGIVTRKEGERKSE